MSLGLESPILSILDLVESKQIEPKLVKRSELESSRILARLLAIERFEPDPLSLPLPTQASQSTQLGSGLVESSRVESNRIAACQRVGRPGVQRWPDHASGSSAAGLLLLLALLALPQWTHQAWY